MDKNLIELLGEELSNQVKEKLGDTQLGITNNGTLVPADKHENLKAELKDLKTQFEKTQEDLKKFEGSNDTIEELKTKLKETSEGYETFKAETEKREKNRVKSLAIENALKSSNALPSSIDLLINTFDLETIQVDSEGKLVDADKLVGTLKESRKELFIEKNLDGDRPDASTGADSSEMSDQDFFDSMMKSK